MKSALRVEPEANDWALFGCTITSATPASAVLLVEGPGSVYVAAMWPTDRPVSWGDKLRAVRAVLFPGSARQDVS